MTDENLADLIERDIIGFDQVSRFPGVGITGNIQNMLSRDRSNPCIRISEEDGILTVNLEIIVYFGANIPQLCYDIQMKIKRDVEEATGMTVRAVNIKVEGLDKPEGSPA